MRLDDATGFAWARVHGFAASASLGVMRRALGPDSRPGDAIARRLTPDSTLLVFIEDGEIVRQAVVGPPVLVVGLTGEGHAPDDAVLSVQTGDPGPCSALRLGE